MLLVITSSRTCKNMLARKSWGICSELQSRKSQTAWIPVSVSMFVYIEDVASAEKIRALLGKMMCFKSCITSNEFFMYDFTNGRSCFILKSNHFEKTDRRLLTLLTTGLKEMGSLCSFS
jgi:hypothetical protein